MHIEYFENLEDALESIRQAEETARALTTPEQAAIGWGDYFEVLPERNYGLRAWGRIYGRKELEESERSCGAPDEEIVLTMMRSDDGFERGYRFARTYSAVEPDGELGDVHVSVMRKITREEFGQARENGWQ